MARLFPQIETSSRQVICEMVWHELLRRGDVGASPTELAADLLKSHKATGRLEECAALLTPFLEELAGTNRATRDGERFIAFKAS